MFSFPTSPLLAASEKRKYVGRTLSRREVGGGLETTVKIPCSALPPRGRCVFIPGPTETLVNRVATTKPVARANVKRHSGTA